MTLTKRLALFDLLGPLLGFATGFWVLLQIVTIAVGGKPTAALGDLVLLPSAYVLGLIPALVAGTIDHVLQKKKYGPLCTCVAGYLLGLLPIGASIATGLTGGPYILVIGLIGALPALVCSLIARWISKGLADRGW